MSEIGFKLQGKFYPWTMLDDWSQRDNRLAVRVAGCSIRKMLAADSDNIIANFAFAAVAFWHANPLASEDEVSTYIDSLKASDLELIGFSDLGKDDARPPDETQPSDSSENTEPSSESTPENSDPKTSGSPTSDESSTSGPQSQLENSPTAI